MGVEVKGDRQRRRLRAHDQLRLATGRRGGAHEGGSHGYALLPMFPGGA
jgi:hypothetical protein